MIFDNSGDNTQSPKNLALLLKDKAKLLADQPLQSVKNKSGVFVKYSYAQVYQHVVELAFALKKLGVKKGTHNIRKGAMPSKNPIETVILGSQKGRTGRHGARVKTENGYVSANAYFRKKYYGKNAKGIIVNLNGNKADFSKENVMLVSKSVYHSLCWRSWFFTDAELTKTAILTAELLSFFPDLTHNENQYYRMRNDY